MKFKAGNDKFKMPPFGMVGQAVWFIDAPRPIPIRMHQTGNAEMKKWREETPVTGTPVYFSVDEWGVGYVYPAPNKDGEMRVRYYPPAVEI